MQSFHFNLISKALNPIDPYWANRKTKSTLCCTLETLVWVDSQQHRSSDTDNLGWHPPAQGQPKVREVLAYDRRVAGSNVRASRMKLGGDSERQRYAPPFNWKMYWRRKHTLGWNDTSLDVDPVLEGFLFCKGCLCQHLFFCTFSISVWCVSLNKHVSSKYHRKGCFSKEKLYTLHGEWKNRDLTRAAHMST